MSEKDLIKKRGSFKGRLTVFFNYLLSLAEPIKDSDARELQLRIGKIELLYEQYDEIQLQLECLVEDVQSQYNERSEFEALYYKVLSKAQGLLKDFNNAKNDNRSVTSNNNKLVRLPTIQLPKFSGSYDNWLEFHDTFTSLIHSNDEIDNVNKFHYLRSSLEGSAAVVIRSIQFSSDNYAVAWKLLCERFENKRLLIQNHVSALFNIDCLGKESSVTLKRLIDQLNKNLSALKSLGEPVEHWDTLLIHIVSQKLDQKTYREWEEYKGHLNQNDSITFNLFLQFLRNRADLLETLETSRCNNLTSHTKLNPKLKSMVSQNPNSSYTNKSLKVCPRCKGDHHLYSCSQFLALSNEARLKLLPSFKVCYNCLRTGHFANVCKSTGCKVCKRKHNSLVHVNQQKTVSPEDNNHNNLTQNASTTPAAPSSDETVSLAANVDSYCGQGQVQVCDVLLSTALVKICDNNQQHHIVRAVLDSGSTSCLLTESLCNKLNLKTNEIDVSILGINNVTSHVGKTCRVNIKSLNEHFTTDIFCYVLPSITNNIPSREIDISNLRIPSNICLADPTFYKPSQIDLLIGADLYWELLGSQQIKLHNKNPVLFETRLGWIISGPIPMKNISLPCIDIKCNLTDINPNLNKSIDNTQVDLLRFWQLEEIDTKLPHYTPDEKFCEDYFNKTTFRLDDGRFCVRLPLKKGPEVLGDSFHRAKRCLLSLERRLIRQPDISQMYYDFMSEYQSLGHMTEINELDADRPTYYLPHHGVLRDSSNTTKLRVVFNASSPTTSGLSLNDIQMVGPTVQDDLLSILLRFRQHKYILSADVEKMYRQIIVHPSERSLQLILWRESPREPIKTFQLNTVTYGTASAPFLATRCLKKIALDCTDQKVAEIIEHDFYVDDLLTGGNNIDEVRQIRQKVTDELASTGMSLRKWVSNEPQLVPDVVNFPLNLNIGSYEPNKLLGLGWQARSDTLCFPVASSQPTGNTKRDLLSAIARIFDPLGLLAPYVILMKMLLQTLWLHKLTWDEALPDEVKRRWDVIIKTLPLLNNVFIPRLVLIVSDKKPEIHVFMDASERAYGACIYLRSLREEDGDVTVRLLIAKSRVAPLKPTTIPRLELCGALTAARLFEKVKTSLRLVFSNVYFWTDSMIVLGWLRMPPSKLQPFVRNRVAEILEKAGNYSWKHVPTHLNPADLISRGMDISNLQTSALWWSGPEYLKSNIKEWPNDQYITVELPETRPDVSINMLANQSHNNMMLIDFSRFSNYLRLIRSVAYVLRYIKLCKREVINSTFLEQEELEDALLVIIKISQFESFPEYKMLIDKHTLPKKSPLLKFNIFLDKDKVMRVGGRLNNSTFNYNKKHPIIIQSTHRFTKLLFSYEHIKLMHAGPQLLLASIRETYWPIRGRNLAKLTYHNCVRCTRMRGNTVTPIMGNLPQQRLLPGGFPFENVGVDYAGPVMSASRQGRGCRLVKTYICIFICFTTKSVHLELVGDLTSNCYLLALRRFIARRGKPINIYSDNGTSFVGACNDLSQFLKDNCNSLSEGLANECINFKFIPAYSPHFGGLWEAGVKSTKYHLQRVLGNCNLTFEELNTTLTQIEAILNSRPLTPLSSDPADLNPLTPGHFLIGRPLTSLPQRDFQQCSSNALTRFQRIEQLRQHFWSRWSKEYVAELQQRIKWRSCKDELKLDTLVVVKEDNLPPLKWKLGRIVAVHPGPDKIVRVADIRTPTGVIRRAFSKICPLPVMADCG